MGAPSNGNGGVTDFPRFRRGESRCYQFILGKGILQTGVHRLDISGIVGYLYPVVFCPSVHLLLANTKQ